MNAVILFFPFVIFSLGLISVGESYAYTFSGKLAFRILNARA